MKQKYVKYYQTFSAAAPFVFLWDSLFAPSRLARLSLANRQQDYAALGGKPDLLALHGRLHQQLLESRARWESYDYGEGYFYQSSPELGIRGLRDTQARFEDMELALRVQGKRVLEIGCNTGFLTLKLAGTAEHVTAFDINPYLVRIGELGAEHLGLSNVRFLVSCFEELDIGGEYDAVISFANHSTYDQNTRQTVQQYLDRCRDHIRPGGTFLFESHPPQHEGAALESVCEEIARRFEVDERRLLFRGTFLDRDRTYIAARRSNGEA
ncbi:MAG: methyltransferase domain-containing protein [Armatimonadetes bacterium]|nr:methyltransferase domain-containing protein [Armatimonadota bacterium]